MENVVIMNMIDFKSESGEIIVETGDIIETESDQIEFELWLQGRYQDMSIDLGVDPRKIDIDRAKGYYAYLKSSKGRVEQALDAIQYEGLMRSLKHDLDDDEIK